MKLRRLSKEAFEVLADQTRFQDRARTIAREILVDGRAVAEVAQEHQVTWKRAWFIINKLEKTYLESDVLADGLVEVTLQLPEPISRGLVQYSQLVNACCDDEQRNKSIRRIAADIDHETDRLAKMARQAEGSR